MVTINQCLRCKKEAEGSFYPFSVGKLQFGAKLGGRPPYRIIREERVFICRRCAEARMRANAWVVLIGCGPLTLAIALPLLGFSAWNLLYEPFLTRFGTAYSRRLLFVSLGILGTTALFGWAAFRQLHYVRSEAYRHQRFPDTSVTWMAIKMRKKAIVKELGLINAKELRFFTEAERRRLGL
jgi:hypothetical protein